MTTTLRPSPQASRNLKKHTNLNPIHRWLLQRFHAKATLMLRAALCEVPRKAGDTGAHVLDAGCGEGFAARYFSERLPDVCMVGLDSRPEALVYARGQNAPRSRWLAGDVARLPLRDSSVPVVVCLEVLEHLADPWAALQELSRVSSDYLLLSVPSQPFFALANLMRGKNLRTLGDDPDHLSHWTARTFLRLIRRQVEVVKVAHSFPWVIVLARPRRA